MLAETADYEAESGAKEGEEMPEGDPKRITLDMTDPNIADAFANCEEGEQLTVEKKDDTEIVLAYSGGEEEPKPASGQAPETKAVPAGDDTEPEYMSGANTAVKRFMKNKNKQ